MERLLITGAKGFLGARAAEYFSGLGGGQVLAVGRREMELTDPAAVERVFREFAPSRVLHTAAVSDVGACAADPAGSERVNVEGARLVAEACGKAGAKLVFCSSDQVYLGRPGREDGGPYKEEEPCAPAQPYGQQKLAAEALCAALAPGAVSLRLSWLYDARPYPCRRGDLAQTLQRLAASGQSAEFSATDRRGVTDVWELLDKLPTAFALAGGAWNWGSPNEAGLPVWALARRGLAALGADPALARPRELPPRELRMDPARARAAGVRFTDAADALEAALRAAR